MKKNIGAMLVFIGLSFAIGWICHQMYPNFRPTIIFLPLVIIGTILQWS